jgi:predicted CxxxxCH...CXXCH cytochrome family protein
MSRVSLGVAATAVAALCAACGDARNVSTASPVGAESSCSGCHTAPGEGPPFRDQTGSTDPNRLTVGAHDAHLHGNLTSNITCGECHVVPRRVTDPGHMDAVPPQTVKFGGLATTGGANPVYVNQGCAATYCHGTLPGGTVPTPKWLGGLSPNICDSCHGFPPATGRHVFHVTGLGFTCTTCHGPVIPSTHVNGVVNVQLTVNGVAVSGFTPGVGTQPPTCQTAQCHGGLPRAWTTP